MELLIWRLRVACRTDISPLRTVLSDQIFKRNCPLCQMANEGHILYTWVLDSGSFCIIFIHQLGHFFPLTTTETVINVGSDFQQSSVFIFPRTLCVSLGHTRLRLLSTTLWTTTWMPTSSLWIPVLHRVPRTPRQPHHLYLRIQSSRAEPITGHGWRWQRRKRKRKAPKHHRKKRSRE